MKRNLMDILACPVCKGSLTLAIVREERDEVIEGTLRCNKCNESYPIKNSIPVLLPAALRK